ncbi:MAG: HAD-IIB family hydrolase [Rhizobiaceae bacterium]
MPGLIIFTDLDGTLLDHGTYRYDAARPALDALRARNIPLVPASSKTAAELVALRGELDITKWPAIVENGAGVLSPEEGDASAFDDTEYRRLRRIVDDLPDELRRHFAGFGDWSTDEIAERTGLPPGQARLSARRQFSEPGIWNGDEKELAAFLNRLSAQGVSARQGGRFLTLSFGADKANRMDEVVARLGAGDATIVMLGDAPNDVRMIERADIGVIVHNPSTEALPRLAGEATSRIRRTRLTGPAGWNEAVLAILSASGMSE